MLFVRIEKEMEKKEEERKKKGRKKGEGYQQKSKRQLAHLSHA